MLAVALLLALVVWALWWCAGPGTRRAVDPAPLEPPGARVSVPLPRLPARDLAVPWPRVPETGQEPPGQGAAPAAAPRRGAAEVLTEDDVISFGLALEASPDVLGDLLAERAVP